MASKQGDKSNKPTTGSSVKDENKSLDKEAVTESPTQEIINAFGGLRPLASKLGIAVSTVQGWKERDSIPSARHEDILRAAAKAKITLDVVRVRESDLLLSDEAEQGASSDLGSSSSSGKSDIKSPLKASSAIPVSGSKATVGDKNDDAQANTGVEKDNGIGLGPNKADELLSDTQTVAVVKKGGSLNSFFYGVGFCALAMAAAVFFRSEWLPLVEKIPTFGGEAETTSVSSLEERIVDLEQDVFNAQSKSIDQNRFLALSETVRTLKLQQSELERQLNDLTNGGVVVTSSDADKDLVEALRTELEQTRQRMDAIESTGFASSSVGDSSDGASVQQLASIRTQMNALISEVASLKSGDAVPSQSLVGGPATGDVYLALGVLQLRDALRGSGPFVKELDLVRAVAPENSTIHELVSPLSSFAAVGLPSLTDLRASFPSAARDALSADKIAGGQTWVDKAIGRVTDVVSIRPIDILDGQGTSSVLARAENYLKDGDLSGALQELENLTSAATSGMENWLLLAKQRREGEQISQQLALLLIGVTAQGSGAGGIE
ncbi:carph-isopro domain-containing protein [uncultured Kiloniella sp.]|uniref:COG4223 family protein n=1 Tax=uncultured Kiloniella sp. TaxID=1133091 RepID=UPI00260BE1D8|nr:mitofilin family membrane protein [uncultured Kiloniella sp.]